MGRPSARMPTSWGYWSEADRPFDEWARSGPRRRPTIWGTWQPNLSPPIGINHLDGRNGRSWCRPKAPETGVPGGRSHRGPHEACLVGWEERVAPGGAQPKLRNDAAPGPLLGGPRLRGMSRRLQRRRRPAVWGGGP